MLSGKSITLLVSGSIAAYKSAELLRLLQSEGATVRVAMSESAAEFISPMTLQTLSGAPVAIEMFDVIQEAEIGHISLADDADVVLVAPATANTIAKAAFGLAEDMLGAVLLATKAPVVFAPAMNVNMWNNPATQDNVGLLRSRGIVVMEPEVGELACGWQGAGRFPENNAILDEVVSAMTPKDLKGCKVLVTAGPTQEKIDPIRYINNRSSGKMGYALAMQARHRGADVCLITGPSPLEKPGGMQVVCVETAQEMHDAVFHHLQDKPTKGVARFVFMAAAVSDHRPADPSQEKLKKDKSLNYSLEFEPCPDILHQLGQRRQDLEQKTGERITLVGFAAETAVEPEELVSLAMDKLERKNADLIVGNYADSMGKDTNEVWLVERGGRHEHITTSDKHHIANKIIDSSLNAHS